MWVLESYSETEERLFPKYQIDAGSGQLCISKEMIFLLVYSYLNV